MNTQEILAQKITALARFTAVLNAIPAKIAVNPYSCSSSVRIETLVSLKQAKEIIKIVRTELHESSTVDSYYLDTRWVDGKRIEVLDIGFNIHPLGDNDYSKRTEIRFEIRSPKAALKALGVNCKIETVKEEARLIPASTKRAVVCSA